jgi:hypothetical protein
MPYSLRTFAGTLVFALGALAQSEEPKIVVNLGGLRYPPIAKQARIQGNVVFRVTASGRELASSANPLLTPAAEDNLKTWTPPPLEDGSYLVTYHFEILQATRSVPIGSGLGRFLRRLVGAPTTKAVGCFPTGEPDPAPRYVIATGGGIDVFAEGHFVCLPTQVAAVSHL